MAAAGLPAALAAAGGAEGLAGAGVGAGGDLPGAASPQRSHNYLEFLLLGFSSALHILVSAFGIMFLFHAVPAALALHAEDSLTEIASGFSTAAIVLVGTLAMPFSNAASVLVTDMEENISFAVTSVWIPAILGVFLTFTASLAQLTLRKFRCCVIPYALLAVVLLVWQAEIGKLVSKVVEEESMDLAADKKSFDVAQARQYHMFNISYEGFSTVYEDNGCSATVPTGGKTRVRVKCSRTTMEGQFLEMAIMQLCTATSFSERRLRMIIVDFERRVERCMTQGRKLRMFSTRTSTRDNVFCRCKAATFDWMRVVSRWATVVWIGEMVASFGVLYFGVAPSLAKMGKDERREILLFAAVGLVGMSYRVLICEDGVAMDSEF
eukprot:TRINITY_DN55743_c0_g1_i1.p1 TRINITY_DN55743_c0_g1~~TRINITY_DN55743_c0_g1_i1.p1  ORF type:complete len:394 (+),score=61.91 TRINITY_DN55743_c0_g1_i1:43-1182(+)